MGEAKLVGDFIRDEPNRCWGMFRLILLGLSAKLSLSRILRRPSSISLTCDKIILLFAVDLLFGVPLFGSMGKRCEEIDFTKDLFFYPVTGFLLFPEKIFLVFLIISTFSSISAYSRIVQLSSGRCLCIPLSVLLPLSYKVSNLVGFFD